MAFAEAILIQSLVHICKGRHWNPNFLKVRGLPDMDFRDASISPTASPTYWQISDADFIMRSFHLLQNCLNGSILSSPLYIWCVAQCLIYCTHIKSTLTTGFEISHDCFSSQILIVLLSLTCAMKPSLDCFCEAFALHQFCFVDWNQQHREIHTDLSNAY